jgi:deoxyribonuclease IV
MIGPHMPIGPGLAQAVDRARLVGAGAIQVFTDTPTAWQPRAEPHEGLTEFRRQLHASRIELLVHASYLVNLATPDPVTFERSILRMGHELDAARQFGASALNVHIGSHKGSGAEAGIERVGAALARILEPRPADGSEPRLVLEDSAGQGGGIGVTMEELGAILDAAERHGADRSRLGVCLDTAHLWAAGYALDDPVAIDDLLQSADAALGPTGLAMLHLNDSRVRRGSRVDRHEHIGGGAIGVDGLRHLVQHPRLAGLPMILETPGMDSGWDAVNMARVRSLIAGEVLEPLPAVAFLARGGRT